MRTMYLFIVVLVVQRKCREVWSLRLKMSRLQTHFCVGHVKIRAHQHICNNRSPLRMDNWTVHYNHSGKMRGEVEGLVKREVLFCTTLILVGTLDWLTTIVGVVFFGATETNPLLASLTQTNMLLFSALKLSAVTLIGLLFYKAQTKTKTASQISPFAKKFLHSGYALCLLFLTFVVLNNFSAIIKVAWGPKGKFCWKSRVEFCLVCADDVYLDAKVCDVRYAGGHR